MVEARIVVLDCVRNVAGGRDDDRDSGNGLAIGLNEDNEGVDSGG